MWREICFEVRDVMLPLRGTCSDCIDRSLERIDIESRNTKVKVQAERKEISATKNNMDFLFAANSLYAPEKVTGQPPYSAVSSSSWVCAGGDSTGAAITVSAKSNSWFSSGEQINLSDLHH
jgi:hypothetical protein